MPVASCTSLDARAGPERLLHDTIRPSVGALATSRRRGLVVVGRSPSQWKLLPFFSSERSAFCSASVKLRPIAMASPTDFIVVVRVWSAAGNFSTRTAVP